MSVTCCNVYCFSTTQIILPGIITTVKKNLFQNLVNKKSSLILPYHPFYPAVEICFSLPVYSSNHSSLVSDTITTPKQSLLMMIPILSNLILWWYKTFCCCSHYIVFHPYSLTWKIIQRSLHPSVLAPASKLYLAKMWVTCWSLTKGKLYIILLELSVTFENTDCFFLLKMGSFFSVLPWFHTLSCTSFCLLGHTSSVSFVGSLALATLPVSELRGVTRTSVPGCLLFLR